MIITMPNKEKLQEEDLIVLLKDEEFIGYGKVKTVKDDIVEIDCDRRATDAISWLKENNIEYNIEIS